MWYKKLWGLLEHFGFYGSEVDHALFITKLVHSGMPIHCLMAVHVDDGMAAANSRAFLDCVKVSDGGTVNLLSRSYGVYNINELGLQKCTSSPVDETDQGEKTYRCASHEMRIFGAIGSGASSVVQRAMHIPSHRILALKKINIFEKVLLMQR